MQPISRDSSHFGMFEPTADQVNSMTADEKSHFRKVVEKCREDAAKSGTLEPLDWSGIARAQQHEIADLRTRLATRPVVSTYLHQEPLYLPYITFLMGLILGAAVSSFFV